MVTTARYGIAQIDVKRGDSLVLGCTATGEDGLPIDLATITVRAQARHRGALVADLAVQVLQASAGTYELTAPGDTTTAAWPVGAVDVDIEYAQPASGGRRNVRSTQTFVLHVLPDVTQEPQP